MKSGSIVLLFYLSASSFAASSDSAFAPLRAYDGAWRVTRTSPAGQKPDELVNQCSSIGQYFACQQSVNGAVSALLIFVPADTPNRFYTQSVNPQGRALGKGDLEISGEKWVFTSTWDQGGKTIYYQTTNTFIGHDRIHFEQKESTNRRDWTTTSAGDDTRVHATH
ncbi:MAG TPA: hypothetical protein VH302_03125 [Bryobacteraceae bacterium]|jgi:hypothetical protein|nr:hypothetical protein [Bryobacteraceae bacterium]